MRYINIATKKGIGVIKLPNRKNYSLVAIKGNREKVIGTVKDKDAFIEAIEDVVVIYEDRTKGRPDEEQ